MSENNTVIISQSNLLLTSLMVPLGRIDSYSYCLGGLLSMCLLLLLLLLLLLFTKTSSVK